MLRRSRSSDVAWVASMQLTRSRSSNHERAGTPTPTPAAEPVIGSPTGLVVTTPARSTSTPPSVTRSRTELGFPHSSGRECCWAMAFLDVPVALRNDVHAELVEVGDCFVERGLQRGQSANFHDELIDALNAFCGVLTVQLGV